MKKGIDISKYQGNIDFNAVKKSEQFRKKTRFLSRTIKTPRLPDLTWARIGIHTQ